MKKEKIKQNDFKKEDLPKTRPALFFDILKNQTAIIVNTSLLTTLFSIPFLVISIFLYFILSKAITEGQGFDKLFAIIFYGSLIMSPTIILTLLGFSSSFYVAKKLAWGEGLLLKNHFFQSLKEEFKRSILISIILVLSFLLFLNGTTYLAIFYHKAPIWTGIGIAILIGQFFLMMITTFYYFAYQSIYQNNFRETFKNSFLMATGRLHFSLLFFLLFPGLLIALILPHYISAFVAIFLYALFNFVGIFSWTLLTHQTFDLFINRTHYPDYVKKGLYIEKINDKEEVG